MSKTSLPENGELRDGFQNQAGSRSRTATSSLTQQQREAAELQYQVENTTYVPYDNGWAYKDDAGNFTVYGQQPQDIKAALSDMWGKVTGDLPRLEHRTYADANDHQATEEQLSLGQAINPVWG